VVVCASLVVGDEFRAGQRLQSSHAVDYHQVTAGETSAVEAAASRIAEFLGDPGELVSRMDDVEVLVVHCAPVTREVLAASASLRLVGCARGGPVNVDVDAASDLRIRVVTTPGKNAAAVESRRLRSL
jgi:D-3-phosphoglycerate dehydrogenase / 2-oxoglutarate reductase